VGPQARSPEVRVAPEIDLGVTTPAIAPTPVALAARWRVLEGNVLRHAAICGGWDAVAPTPAELTARWRALERTFSRPAEAERRQEVEGVAAGTPCEGTHPEGRQESERYLNSTTKRSVPSPQREGKPACSGPPGRQPTGEPPPQSATRLAAAARRPSSRRRLPRDME